MKDSGFGGGVEEGADVGFEFGEVFVVKIHHVAGLVDFVVNVFLKIRGQAKMLRGVFGFGEGSGKVVDAVFHFDLQVGVGNHGVCEIEHDVGGAGEERAIAGGVLPIPIVIAKVCEDVVFAVGIVFQLFADVLIEGGDERAADGGFLGIVVGGIADEIVGGAGESGRRGVRW